VQFKKLCVDNYGTRTVSLALEIYDSDWKSSLSSLGHWEDVEERINV
jgi:hypothetical protein